MDLLLAALIGGVVGYFIGRAGNGDATVESTLQSDPPRPTTADRINQRLTKRQQRILESLPQDDPRPTLDDLIAEEAARLGIEGIAADADIPIGVRLAVFKRDLGEAAPEDLDQYGYRIDRGATPPFEVDNVRLQRRADGQ